MELDPRQGDLFLDLLDGGKKDNTPNYRAKLEKMLDVDIDKPNPKPLPNPG